MKKISIAGFTFESINSVIVEYPDGHKIDLGMIKPIQVGIIKEKGRWVVNIITKEAIMKLSNGITEDLDVIGFHFDKIDDAITAHIFLVNQLLDNGL